MKGARMTIAELKQTAAASLNKEVIEDLHKPDKKKKDKQLPGQPCMQVQWMWGQLGWWSLTNGIPVFQEHKFHPKRKWRFDFALPNQKIGIEYEGINSNKSRHTTLIGFTGDTEKYNAAQSLGWKVIRFTAKNYKKVLTELNNNIMNSKKKVQYNPIVTEKITKDCWVAKTRMWMPGSSKPDLKIEVEQKGKSETDAREKLLKFLGEDAANKEFNEVPK
jgi:very-short-patch-repair endonuclease